MHGQFLADVQTIFLLTTHVWISATLLTIFTHTQSKKKKEGKLPFGGIFLLQF